MKDEAKDAPPVISGMRNTSTVLIYLDLAKALDAGLEFGISENGVVLSAGDGDKVISTKFFRKVEDRKERVVVMRDGEVVGDAHGGKGMAK